MAEDNKDNKADMILAGMPSLWRFFSECFVPLNDLSLPLKHHHEVICDTIQEAILGTGDPNVRYYVINMPPRCGKTKIMECACLWCLLLFSDSKIIYTSYSATLAEKSIQYIRECMAQKWFQQMAGCDIRGSKMKQELVTTRFGGEVYGAGAGATIIGFGAGLKRPCGGMFIIDDPSKPDQVQSVIGVENLNYWFETVPKTRRNSAVHTPIIICAQRLGEDDLCGYVLKNYGPSGQVKHVKFPAIVDGVNQIPETVSDADFEAMQKSRLQQFTFWTLYQQEPIALGGNLIKIDSLRRFDVNEPIQWEQRLISCDTAMRTKEHNDESVFQLWGKKGNNVYLLDMVKGKWESPDLLRIAKNFWDKHRVYTGGLLPSPIRFTVEAKAAGIGMAQELRARGIPVEEIERHSDKVSRVQAVLPYIDSGMVYIPKDDQVPWMNEYIAQLAAFSADGKATHDDMVDATCDGINLLLLCAPSGLDCVTNEQTHEGVSMLTSNIVSPYALRF